MNLSEGDKMLEKLIDKLQTYRGSIIILTLAIIITCFFFFTDIVVKFFGSESEDIRTIHLILVVFLTILLVLVAWLQLTGLNKTSKSDFLLRIDSRYGNPEIIKARLIIHKIHRQLDNEYSSCEENRIKKISEKIVEISQSTKPGEMRDFIYLLNFIDFLETIAYFCNKGRISEKELAELSGDSIVYYYGVFKKWIFERRGRYHSRYYCEIEDLAQKISKKNQKKYGPTN